MRQAPAAIQGDYSTSVLPPLWGTVTLFNPLVYLISGFRWSFFGIADVNVGVSLAMTVLFLVVCMAIIWWFFKTGYRLKNEDGRKSKILSAPDRYIDNLYLRLIFNQLEYEAAVRKAKRGNHHSFR